MTRTSAEDRRLKRLTDACVWQLYDLRHTFASWLGQCGRTLKEAQEALGHQSIVMPIRDRSSSGPRSSPQPSAWPTRWPAELTRCSR